MPPKPKIIRSKPELSGNGNAVLRKLHGQHWDNFERNMSPTSEYIAKHTKLLNELYAKTCSDMEGLLVNFFKVMITNFATSELGTDWTTFIGTLKWTNTMKETLESI